ncbi:MAG: amidase [Myxococcota bacterium]
MDLLRRPLTEQLDALASGTCSCRELMEATLARIDATQAKLGAFTWVADHDELLEAADAADAARSGGRARPLEGIPLGVKDLEDVAGVVTSMGSIPFRDNRAERDSVQVERLRAAGAIVVGKTNTPEFGFTAITKNLLFGVTHNPWNLDHTPGGSSGGSSAAIAGGVVSLATASDGGGSVRLPASMTGCFGLKPSLGRIPHETKLWSMDDTAVFGPLTRSVEDAAIHLDEVVGAHPFDPNSLPHPGLSYREILPNLPSGLRVAYSADLGSAAVQSDIATVVRDAARFFERGHQFREIDGGPPALGKAWGLGTSFDLAGAIEPLLPEREDDFARAFLVGIRAARKMTPTLWGEIRQERQALNHWCADLFDRFDLLVTPTVPFDPPPARGPFPDSVEGRSVPPAGVASFTIPFNLSWHPAATVRAGFSRAGLPVGLQIVGPRHRDDLVLQAAYAFEQAFPWHDDWPEV